MDASGRADRAGQRLWNALSLLFSDDDGSLPEVRLVGVSEAGAAAMFETLRGRARPLTRDQTVWHDELRRDVPLADVPDAGHLAATGRLGFHVVLRGIESEGVRLPDIGVHVWKDEVALDYRKGDEWDAASLAAFAELLGELLRLDEGADLDLEEDVPRELRNRFRQEVAAFLHRRRA